MSLYHPQATYNAVMFHEVSFSENSKCIGRVAQWQFQVRSADVNFLKITNI